jgi:hypothetical protein
MNSHENIQRIAAKSFAEHIMQDAPAQSWRLGKPGTGCYAFRVTWAPGMIAVSGDIGSAIYEIWPAFQTLEGAIRLVARADYDYLCGKSNIKREYDREETVKGLVEYAYRSLRDGHKPALFEQICDEYGGDPDKPRGRKEAIREFRDDCSLSAERIYDLTGDFEDPVYSYPSDARWAFEALKLWAVKIQAAGASSGEAA